MDSEDPGTPLGSFVVKRSVLSLGTQNYRHAIVNRLEEFIGDSVMIAQDVIDSSPGRLPQVPDASSRSEHTAANIRCVTLDFRRLK